MDNSNRSRNREFRIQRSNNTFVECNEFGRFPAKLDSLGAKSHLNWSPRFQVPILERTTVLCASVLLRVGGISSTDNTFSILHNTGSKYIAWRRLLPYHLHAIPKFQVITMYPKTYVPKSDKFSRRFPCYLLDIRYSIKYAVLVFLTLLRTKQSG